MPKSPEEKQLKTKLKALKNDLSNLKKDCQKSITDSKRKNLALQLDGYILVLSSLQTFSVEIGVNINSDAKKCVALAKDCWPHLGSAPIGWSKDTLTYAKNWKVLLIVDGDHPELENQTKKSDIPPEESKLFDDPKKHWQYVAKRLDSEAKDYVKYDLKNRFVLKAGVFRTLWNDIKAYHKKSFQLKDTDEEKFDALCKAGFKGKSVLFNNCLNEAKEILSGEGQEILAGRESYIFELPEADFETADEHWQYAMLPQLGSELNDLLTNDLYESIEIKGSSSETMKKFFAPIKRKHRGLFDVSKHGMSKKFANWENEMKNLVVEAKEQLEDSFGAVLKAKMGNAFFEYKKS